MQVKANLFVIGAMKAGTTSLHEYLGTHPDIFMTASRWKEPGFFVREKTWNRGPDWYASLFTDVAKQSYRGESSTHYTMRPKYEGVVDRIAEYNPASRFVYVVRDPVQRAISHYWHLVRWDKETRDPETAVKEIADIVNFSSYAYQLEPYLAKFGRDRIFVVSFERLISDRNAVLRDIFDWLGLDRDIPLDPVDKVFNATPARIVQTRGKGLVDRFRYSFAWKYLSVLVPAKIKKTGSRFAVKAVSPKEVDVTEAISYLRKRLEPQARQLCLLLNRKFPEWTTTFTQEGELIESNGGVKNDIDKEKVKGIS